MERKLQGIFKGLTEMSDEDEFSIERQMNRKPTELHGMSLPGTVRDIARHEAAHLVMLWLLDRLVLASCITKDGGVTRQLKPQGEKTETALEHILHSLAGIIGERNAEVLDDLRTHVGDIEWFAKDTDSYHVAVGIAFFRKAPDVLLNGLSEMIWQLLTRFAKNHREATKLLLENNILDFMDIFDLFEKWDAMYFQGDRPKSDLVARYIFRMFGWRLSRKDWYGWDLKPLPPDWSPRPKHTLEEIAEMVRKELAGKAGQQDE